MAAQGTTPATAQPGTSSLESRAFDIFRDLASSSRGRNIRHSALAEESFQLAAAFNEVAAGVAAGTISTEPAKPAKRQMVKVPRMIAKPDFAGFEQVYDENKKPIVDEVPADHFAFCPNAPLEHPSNVRFVPLGGVKKEELIRRTRADLVQAN